MYNHVKELEYIKNNYPLFKNGTSKREIRHNFFSKIETELQAYLLGFIYSDGSINNERHTLSIHINKQDEDIFELFKIISPDAYTQDCKGYESVSKVRGRSVKNKGSIRLSISSAILISDLHKLGVVENKTYCNLHIPKEIPSHLIRHFIRGYFDGDGCITHSLKKPNEKHRQKNYTVGFRFDICGKTSQLFLEVQKWFTEYNIYSTITYIKRDDMYRLNICRKQNIKDIYFIFYNNSNFYLKRKYEKYSYYVNTEESQLIADLRNAQEMRVNESNNSPTSAERPKLQDENIC